VTALHPLSASDIIDCRTDPAVGLGDCGRGSDPAGRTNRRLELSLKQWILALVAASAPLHAFAQSPSTVMTVASKDGTPLAVECAGSGPSLVIVHGGTGDRRRWTPLFPFFASQFTVCAMDRRGHGASGNSSEYTLLKEAEDVAAVVNSRPDRVFVLGHSFGAVAALEAAFLTSKIARLVLYEPPVIEHDHSAVLTRMENLIRNGDREQALVTFMQEIVMISPAEVTAMKARPSWPALVASVESSIRQDRALSAYHFDPKRIHTLRAPTLLLTGSETTSPELKEAMIALQDALSNRRLFVFEGQQHNAMDTVPQQFSDVVRTFLTDTANTAPAGAR
jgi:pimeloyl-ACP methyl ester carboxylesterase